MSSQHRRYPIRWMGVLVLVPMVGLAMAERVQGQMVCGLCLEHFNGESYWHAFDSQGQAARLCEPVPDFGGVSHQTCHNDPVAGACDTHDLCTGGEATAVAFEVTQLVSTVEGERPEGADETLRQAVFGSHLVSFVPEGRLLQILDCRGQVAVAFTVSEAVREVLLAG